jgi:ABC-type Fe3+/spermidine/putrescine transport system ATPase subunit
LEVAAGETLAVIGPSGSGKSTLLRAIAGLEPLVSGRILLDGADLVDVEPHRRGIGMMFQDHVLFPHLDVADNIGYGLDRAGVDKAERRARIEEMLSLVGLEGFGPRTVDQLSGGEAQRVALARALAPAPGLLMLDEPLGSLDRVLRDQLVDDLDLLLHRMGQTSLHITHDQAEAFALADRVAVLADGVLVALGTPKELWDDPGSRFVAEFLGRPNVWTLEPAGSETVRWVEAGVVLRGELTDHGPVVIPVEALSADPEAGDGIDGRIVGSRFNQGRYRHRVAVTAGTDPVTAVFADDVERKVGDSVTLQVDLDRALPVEHRQPAGG